MTETSLLATEEYRALRATIRERGTLRLFVTALTFVAWSALAIAVQTLITLPVLTLIPLLTLATGFEVVFATHVGIERIGRYLYVHYESNGQLPIWEHAVSQLGPAANRGSGLDPLFAIPFIVAALLNLIPLLFMPLHLEAEIPRVFSIAFAVLAVAHAAFIVRVFSARRFARAQRPRDTELFQKAAGPRTE